MPLFLWLMVTGARVVHVTDSRGRWRAWAVAIVCFSDVFCAITIGWLLRGHWFVSLLIGMAFFWLRMVLADCMVAPDEREVEIALSGADGEFRDQLIRLMERKRQMQLFRERVEEARQRGESLTPAIREHLPQSQGWTPGTILGTAGVLTACGALNLACLAVLVWLIGHLARG